MPFPDTDFDHEPPGGGGCALLMAYVLGAAVKALHRVVLWAGAVVWAVIGGR